MRNETNPLIAKLPDGITALTVAETRKVNGGGSRGIVNICGKVITSKFGTA
jgi:hypothetical protein